jgi:flagellar secretion chaperone FliS
MTNPAAQNYLKMRVMTATPEQLQLMLYDQARKGLAEKNYEQSYTNIVRVQKILAELTSALKPDVAPEICKNLSALYTYVYKKLIEANVDHKVEALEESIELLKYQRDTWAMLLEKLGKDKAAAQARNIDIPEPDKRMEGAIRLSA